jgi:hypothetical protein
MCLPCEEEDMKKMVAGLMVWLVSMALVTGYAVAGGSKAANTKGVAAKDS